MATPPARGFREGPYDIGLLNKIFALSSIALLISVLLMVWDDYAREWKGHQEAFRDIEIQRTHDALEAARAQIDSEALAAARAALEEAEKTIADKADKIAKLRAEVHLVEADVQKLGIDYSNLKSEIESLYYFISFYEEHEHPSLEAAQKQRQRMEDEFAKLTIRKEEAEALFAERKAALAAELAAKTEAEKKIDELTAESARIQRGLEKIEHNLINDHLLNAPLLDFVAPTLKIDQIVLRDLHDDLNFASIYKVDRCQTCHQAIDRAGYEHDVVEKGGERWEGEIVAETATEVSLVPAGAAHDDHGHAQPVTIAKTEDTVVQKLPSVFRTHPNLDLFLSATSPHPKGKFGCTICHDGMGHAVDFIRTAHTPDVALMGPAHADDGHVADHGGGGHGEGVGWFARPERERWKKERDWHPRHHWAEAMLPIQLTEGRCLNCHPTNRPLEGAPRLNAGRKVLEDTACYGCHKIRGFETMPKAGPPLTHVADKLDKSWAFAWVKNPKAFRPRTNMPRFFDLSNVDEVEGEGETKVDFPRRQNVEAAAIVTYMFEKSEHREYEAIEPGDAEAGETRFTDLGCIACHTVKPGEEVQQYQDYGPDLSRIADKLPAGGAAAAWLAGWITDPKHYYADGKMPELRVTAEEAADLVAFLLERTEGRADPFPTFDAQSQLMIFEMCVEHLRDKLIKRDAIEQAKVIAGRERTSATPTLSSLQETPFTEAERTKLLAYLGERTINHYGCFGCHEMPGFEGRLGIGAELTTIGSKLISKFDFGHVPIQQTKHDWIAQKIDEPRIFDVTKVKAPRDKLKMPHFGLEKQQIADLTGFLMGLIDREIPAEYKFNPGERDKALLDGRHLVEQKNCIACHYFELPEYEVRATSDGETQVHRLMGIKLLDTRPMLEVEPDQAAGVSFQVWNDVPGLGLTAGQSLTIEFEDGEATAFLPSGSETFEELQIVETKPAFGGRVAREVTRRAVLEESGDEVDLDDLEACAEELEASEIFEYGATIKTSRSFIPPVLLGEGDKVQARWLADFLRQPVTLRPQVKVRMPTFHMSEREIATIVDYFQALSEKMLIQRTTSELLALQERVKAGEFKGKIVALTRAVRDIIDRNQAEHFFTMSFTESALSWAVNPFMQRHGAFEENLERYYLDQEKKHPGWLSLGRELFEDPNINCASCHVRAGRPPGGEPKDWAPDLARARYRLQPGWIHQWVAAPGTLLPDTNMPPLFPEGEQRYQEVFPVERDLQIDAIKDFLMSGLNAGVDVLPREFGPGATITITSGRLDLDSVTSVKIGDATVNEAGGGLVRVKGSGGRTTALQVRVPGGAQGGTQWLVCTDGRYTAKTRVTVGR